MQNKGVLSTSHLRQDFSLLTADFAASQQNLSSHSIQELESVGRSLGERTDCLISAIQETIQAAKEKVFAVLTIKNESELCSEMTKLGEAGRVGVIQLLKDPTHQKWAIETVAQSRLAIPEAVPLFMSYLTHETVVARLMAVRALEAVGNVDSRVVPILTDACSNSSQTVRTQAISSLVAVAGTDAIPALHSILESGDSVAQSRAACELAKMQIDSSRVLPILIQTLYSPHSVEAALAAFALVKLGADAEPALPALRRTHDKWSEWEAGDTMNTIQKIESAVAEARKQAR